MIDAAKIVRDSLGDASVALKHLIESEESLASIESAASVITSSLRSGGKVMSCGNGGSMADAMHFAEELTGRYRDDRPAYAALAISDATHLTCVANDYGFDFVFSRSVEALGQVGDVLFCLSTSGESKNVVGAALAAKKRGMSVIALTGKQGSTLASLSDVCVCTPAGKYADRVQELHIKVIHIVIQIVEASLA